MTRLLIEGTKSSPRIDFDPATGLLDIRGESYPENCPRFYGPVIQWLQEYLDAARPRPLVLNMEILYFNSSTSKTFMDIFDMLDAEASSGRSVEVNWRYQAENDMAQECGEEFLQDVRALRFNLVPLHGDA
jgi:hypothetical protein